MVEHITHAFFELVHGQWEAEGLVGALTGILDYRRKTWVERKFHVKCLRVRNYVYKNSASRQIYNEAVSSLL